MERAPAACPWEVLHGPGSGALSATSSTPCALLLLFVCWAHTGVDVFGSKSDPVFPCCAFISHPRRERDGNWEQVVNTVHAPLWWLLLLIPAVQVLKPPRSGKCSVT